MCVPERKRRNGSEGKKQPLIRRMTAPRMSDQIALITMIMDVRRRGLECVDDKRLSNKGYIRSLEDALNAKGIGIVIDAERKRRPWPVAPDRSAGAPRIL